MKLDTSGTYYISVGVHRFLGEGTYRLSLRDLGTSDTSCGAAKLAGPVQISVADVSREESESTRTYLIFEVTLNRYADKEVRVSYATVDGTARAGQDYESQSGTLVFERRDRTKQIWGAGGVRRRRRGDRDADAAAVERRWRADQAGRSDRLHLRLLDQQIGFAIPRRTEGSWWLGNKLPGAFDFSCESVKRASCGANWPQIRQ